MSTGKITILSLGAGVQSSCLALMAAAGEVTPMPNAAIFADTGDEPAAVYEWLKWLVLQLPFPVHIVKRPGGTLAEETLRIRTSKGGKKYNQHSPPCFLTDGAKTGLMMRQCTGDFKIDVVNKEIRALSKTGRGKYAQVEQWIGISIDEMQRMARSGLEHVENRWPLIEKRMSRRDCIAWMRNHGFPTPPRSACVYCPFKSNDEWRRMKDGDPVEFAKAVNFEKEYQLAIAQIPTVRGKPYLHGSCKPLGEVDFTKPLNQDQQVFGFINECHGMCGV